MKKVRCRHNKMWIIAGGYWYWCYECGAIRQGQQSKTVNGTYPLGPWIKPVGKDGENPADKLIEVATIIDAPACPVRGHYGHQLKMISSHTQDDSNATGKTFECPTGRYRWFVVDGRELSDIIRQRRPRFGWKAMRKA